MKTELKGAFQSGFKVTEKDVRRIVDIVIDKMKSQQNQTVTRKFNYKLANGAIIDTDNIDDVFAEENIGTKKIIYLEIKIIVSAGASTVMSTDIRFADLVLASENLYSILYNLHGESRDPLFVLASELDERIGHIKQWNFRSEGLLLLFSPIVLVLFLVMSFAITGLHQFQPDLSKTHDVIEAYKQGKYSFDVQGLFKFTAELEEARTTTLSDTGFKFSDKLPLIIFFVIFLAGVILWYVLKTFYYPFDFLWGEQTALVQRRERRRNFFFAAVVLALIVGIISSYIAGLLPRF